VLKELQLGSTGQEGKSGYAIPGTDVESQTAGVSQANKQNKDQQHELHVALLSLCVTACEELHLDICDAISPGEGRQGDEQLREIAVFCLAKNIAESNRNLFTAEGLAMMKLATRMVIAVMKKHMDPGCGLVKPAHDLLSLMVMDSLSVSEAMLDVESSMVFAAGKETGTIDTTLDSLLKKAKELDGQIRGQVPAIIPA
jgi:hypothetical protein